MGQHNSSSSSNEMDSGFRILEHPSDIGLEVWGPDLAEVFRQAALGLTSILVDPASVRVRERRTLGLKGSDNENLLVRWLSEILYLYDGADFLVSDVEIRRLQDSSLAAILKGEKVDTGHHQFRMDVKAVTYHQLNIALDENVWTARVFLDI
ncbi:MAG: archease [Bacteroidota bacterium]